MSVPFIRDITFSYGKPDRLSPLIKRVICNNPGPFTYTGSGTYLVSQWDHADAPVAIIDPGPENEEHHVALLTTIGDRPVSNILVTHTHRDHCGGAMRLRAATGAAICAFGPHPVRPEHGAPALDEGADFGFAPDTLLSDDEVVRMDGVTLRAIHTPGHLSNHLCFALEEEQALFTGDHIMGWSTTVVSLPDGNMADYFDSLERLLAREDRIYYPTHGAPVLQPQDFVMAVKQHRMARDAAILSQLAPDWQPLMDIVGEVYRDTDRSLHLAAGLNVQAHLARHAEQGTVEITGPGFPDLLYRRT